ncbi:MAG: glucose/sorbosone dehydrogenase-like protein [Acidimicrobiales bacterium]|nr:glucose/sorbosone dehydrogenase-like protein [Acidimicrobiales bacterium]
MNAWGASSGLAVQPRRGRADGPRRRWRGAAAASALALVTLAGVPTSTAAPAPTTPAAPVLTDVHAKLVTYATGLVAPVAITWRHGDPRMYVAEQGGHVRVVYQGHVVATSLTLTVSTGAEQGLLGIAFSADGTKMYVDYTDANGDTRVDEYTMQTYKAVVSSRRQLLFQKQPYVNHNGGQVVVGPDGMLYVSFGDGGGAGDPQGNGQKLTTLLGKIVRIDPRPRGYSSYQIPPDNPFAGRGFAARGEIWMYGLRNPWRFTFDRTTGDMWIGDVGQNKYEEVDYAPAGTKGQNWGWNQREGFHSYRGAQPADGRDPLFERAHTDGDCSVTGGYVYRGRAIPALTGAYVWGDFCAGNITAVVQQGGVVTQTADLGLHVSQLDTFGESPSGELVVASRAGTIYLIAKA